MIRGRPRVAGAVAAGEDGEALFVDVAAREHAHGVLRVGEQAEGERGGGAPRLAQLRPGGEQFGGQVVVLPGEVARDQGVEVGEEPVPIETGARRAAEVREIEESVGEAVGVVAGIEREVEGLLEDAGDDRPGGEGTPPDARNPVALGQHRRGVIGGVREHPGALSSDEVAEIGIRPAQGGEQHVRHGPLKGALGVQCHVGTGDPGAGERREGCGQRVDAFPDAVAGVRCGRRVGEHGGFGNDLLGAEAELRDVLVGVPGATELVDDERCEVEHPLDPRAQVGRRPGRDLGRDPALVGDGRVGHR